MALVCLEDAKTYLRVDSSDEDDLIESLILASESLCKDVARLTEERWENLTDASLEEDQLTIQQVHERDILTIAVLYTLGYLYEHREEADHHDLTLTLRSLLFAVREGVV